MVLALHPPRRFAGRLHGWQQERDQYADDRDHHQQLHQCKSRTHCAPRFERSL
jgi:hypothetical protein